MKQTKHWLLTIVLLCSFTASAHNFEVGGIYYDITSSTDLTVGVVYKGNKWNSYNEYTGIVTIPETVTYNNITYRVTWIGSSAFSGCSSLTSISLPKSLTEIGNNAFERCISLTSIIIPDGVTSIGDYAFHHCDNLSSVIIGKNVTSIGKYTFSSSSGEHYTGLHLERIINYSNVSFDGIYGSADLLVNVNQCTNIDDFLFDTTGEEVSLVAYIGSDIELNLPSSFNGESYIIGSYAFSKTNITNVVIPNSVTSIGSSSFYNCSGLASLTIGDGVTSIGSSAFYGCSGLESAIIGNGVTSIGSSAFSGCVALKDLTIGSSVSSIESSAFAGCNEIESIYALNPKAITCDESIFATDAYNNAILYAPSDRVFAYEKATPWNKFQIEPMKKFSVTYMVGGEVYETIEMEYGAEITLPENPTKEGYTFMGWSEVPETMPANDITIYGTFTVNKYLVTFKIDDEAIASDSLEYGASIVVPEAPEKEGYTFNGWGEDKTVPANDVTYEGTYSVNSYILTYVVDGEVYKTESLAYGSVITMIVAPSKEGHTFSGWSEAPETMPAENVTISGTFSVNKYLVTFKIGDEVIVSDSLEYGASIVVPEVPDKEGYSFDGWKDLPQMVPANDIVILGSYTANEYLLAFIIDGALYEMRRVRCDENITPLNMKEKEGYTLVWDNWIDVMPAKDYTIRGQYVPNKYTVTYMVGNEVVHTAEVVYGEAIPEYIYEPTAEGDEFLGWIGETYETMPAHDVTYTANIVNSIEQFTIDNSQLTIYDLNGRRIAVDDLRELEKGVYIINGRKVVIK